MPARAWQPSRVSVKKVEVRVGVVAMVVVVVAVGVEVEDAMVH